jgi:uncharacterized delta-60 repeat protein
VAAPAHAAPGDLDLTFSGDGKQTTDFGFGDSGAAAIVRQPDGKIVAVGSLGSGSGRNFALARYNPDGTLDTSFSGDGMQVTDIGGFDDQATGVALQGDGKVVVVGRGGATGFALARYNPDGSLDTTFSGDGKQTTGFSAAAEANGVAIQDDGRIVAAGSVSGADAGDFALARYNPNGTLDTSFSGDGKQTTAFAGFEGATAVVLQEDGKLVAAGGGGDFELARYNADGSLDTSFSGDGKQTTDFGGFIDQATGLALQGNGRIVAAGSSGNEFANDFALARYSPNGTLDTNFAGDGKQTTDFAGDTDGATGVAVQGTGKIVTVGVSGTDRDFALARYNQDGSLDPIFSGDGKQTTDFGGTFDGAFGVALQGDGKIIAGGLGRNLGAASGGDFALARYDFSGTLDPTFSGDGKQTTEFAGPDGAGAMAVQDDGKLVVVGSAGSDFALARYNPDGSLDTTFSGDGRQTTELGARDGASGVAIQDDGKIVAVGRGGFGGDFALARYNPDGTLDTSFSGDGKQKTAFKTNDGATAMALQADGKIVAVGFAGASGSSSFDFAVARYNSNGSLDTTFSGDGKLTTDFGGGDKANGVALQGDGKIVAVGGSDAFALARYNPDGTLDTSFSGDGKQTTGGTFGLANGVAIQGDGKIVAVGLASGVDFTFALARYNPNGSLDASFSADGKQTTTFGGYDEANGVVIQPNGKLVAVGKSSTGPVNGTFPDDFALARYNLNGSLDTTFSGDGKQTTDFGGTDQGVGVALTGGKIVAVGSGLGTDLTNDFALARYLGS